METQDGLHLQRMDWLLCTSLRPYTVTATEDEKLTFKRDIKVKFIRALVSQLESRFSGSQILTALAVFDPANMPQSFISYGEKEIEGLATHFEVDQTNLESEWTQFREVMDTTFRESSFEKLVNSIHTQQALKEMFPAFTKLLSQKHINFNTIAIDKISTIVIPNINATNVVSVGAWTYVRRSMNLPQTVT